MELATYLNTFFKSQPSDFTESQIRELLEERFSAARVKVNFTNDGLLMMNYQSVLCDFGEKYIRQTRGSIFYYNAENKSEPFSIACRPLEKFFNYNEKLADKLDFSNARVFEKKDGSLMKLWFNRNSSSWQWS